MQYKARTCWYHWPFHLIYWNQTKEKYVKKEWTHTIKNKNKKTERAGELGRKTKEEIGHRNQLTALRFQTGKRHQTSAASLWEYSKTESAHTPCSRRKREKCACSGDKWRAATVALSSDRGFMKPRMKRLGKTNKKAHTQKETNNTALHH